MTRGEFAAMLVDAKIPVSTWGIGKAKGVEDLYGEYETGDCDLVTTEGRLVRMVRVAGVSVHYHGELGVLYLHEAKQVFADGRERSRGYTASVWEKFSTRDTPGKAAQRGLKNELGFREQADIVWVPGPGNTLGGRVKKESESYPGLPAVYAFWKFSVFIPEHLFDPKGYVMADPKGTAAYFVWEPRGFNPYGREFSSMPR